MTGLVKAAESAFVDYLNDHELKYTSQRKVILREALQVKGHFTAEELLNLSKKRDQKISKATLYRTLMHLKDSRLLEEHDFGYGRKLYERLYRHHHHDHLICVKCNQILEFENNHIEKLQTQEAQRKGFKIIFHSHKLFGLCKRCRARDAQ
jgi:Fur family transcriptional regulator, ferric uptake regulator